MKKLQGIIVCLLVPFGLLGQAISSMLERAYSAWDRGAYHEAATLFEEAIELQKPSATLLYDMACLYAVKEELNKAIHFLDKAIQSGYIDRVWMRIDPDLSSLNHHTAWPDLLKRIDRAEQLQNVPGKYDRKQKKLLEEVYIKDQKDRLIMPKVQQQFGAQSIEMMALRMRILKNDKANQTLIATFIEKYDWPGKATVGVKGSLAAFYVIQHAPLAFQLKYFQRVIAAANAGDLPWDQVCMMQDRILIRQGKKQLYGSQLMTDPITKMLTFQPIQDLHEVDERRAKVGLNTLKEAAQQMGIDYEHFIKTNIGKS